MCVHASLSPRQPGGAAVPAGFPSAHGVCGARLALMPRSSSASDTRRRSGCVSRRSSGCSSGNPHPPAPPPHLRPAGLARSRTAAFSALRSRRKRNAPVSRLAATSSVAQTAIAAVSRQGWLGLAAPVFRAQQRSSSAGIARRARGSHGSRGVGHRRYYHRVARKLPRHSAMPDRSCCRTCGRVLSPCMPI